MVTDPSGRSLAGITGSNLAGDMDISSRMLYAVRQTSLRRADHSSRAVLPCGCVWVRSRANKTHYTYNKYVESSWNVMANGDAREGKWRENWRLEWVASTLHTTSEHGVSSFTTADAHTSAATIRLN